MSEACRHKDLVLGNPGIILFLVCVISTNIIPIWSFTSARFQILFLCSCVTGRGILTVTYLDKRNESNREYAVIAGLNVWDFVVNSKEIFYMSYGCGESFGNAISWLAVRNEVNRNITLHSPATCRERQGDDNILKYISNIRIYNHTFSLIIPSLLLVWIVSCLVFIPSHWHCSIIIWKVLSLCCKVASNKTLVQPFMRVRGTIGQRTGTAAAWNSSTSSMGLVQSPYGSTKSCRMTSWNNQYGWTTTAQTMYGNMVRFH